MTINCRACGKKKNKFIYTTKKLPEYIWPSTNEKILKSSCKVSICKKCGHIQLQKFSKKKIASFYGSKTFVINNSKEMLRRKQKILKAFGKGFLNKKTLEIGGGTNPFFQNFKKEHFILDSRIEKKIKKKFKKNAIESPFENFKDKDFDLFIMLHTFEHFQNPSEILRKINKISKINSNVLVEVPNFINYVKKKPYYSIFHQHLSMFTLETLKNIFHINGFKLKKVLDNQENIFACFYKSSKKKSIRNYYIKNTTLIKLLKKKLKKISIYLNKNLPKKKFNIISAGGSSTLLLHNFPFLIKKIKYALDVDKRKKNSKLPLTQIKIISKKKDNKLKFINLFSIVNKAI